jgi:hypothetical protein
MLETVPETDIIHTSQRGASPRALVAAGIVAAVIVGGIVLLWAHYGTTVFFETIRNGLAVCFG